MAISSSFSYYLVDSEKQEYKYSKKLETNYVH